MRRAAVAGSFYLGEAGALRHEIRRLLEAAPPPGPARPKALVVPHAGYVYSGPIAASAYAQLRAPGPAVTRVVLVGPSHYAAFAGLALPDAEVFQTPLGAVPVDAAGVALAAALPAGEVSAAAHLREHSLEVQLPFLQVVLGEFSLVPLTVGDASPEDVAQVLHALWGGPETLVICSTDLSHYLTYDEARALDRHTADQVLALDAEGLHHDQACGRTPAGRAAARGPAPPPVGRRCSTCAAPATPPVTTERVVGYGAFALHEPGRGDPAWCTAPEAAGEHGHRAAVATGLARAAVASLFGGPPPRRRRGEAWLDERRACFVSLHERGELRGCIGAIEPRGTLFEELVRCARSAATDDPRFDAGHPDELARRSTSRSRCSRRVEPLAGRGRGGGAAAPPARRGRPLLAGRGAHAPPSSRRSGSSCPTRTTSCATSGARPGCRTPGCPAPASPASPPSATRRRDRERPAPADLHPARWWHALADGRIQCDLCPRDCQLHEGQRGFCFVRQREGDAMVLTT